MAPTSGANEAYATRRQQMEALKERLSQIQALPRNRLCSECPEADPTWASLLKAPVEGGNRFGVLCCYRCSSFHYQMGKQVCTVKNIKMTEEWTEDEIDSLERGGGNLIVNALYEAGLYSVAYDKWRVLQDDQEEEAARKEFVQNKYQHLEYFDPVLYQAHSQRSAAMQNKYESAHTPQSQTRRCRSFEDQNSSSEGNKSRDFVRKPMRRRSQSFHEERTTTDEESSDDDQRLVYNLPGHLAMSASAPDANDKRRRQRRPSMPGMRTGNSQSHNHKLPPRSTPNQRKNRRASIKAEHRNNPSDAELGYGEQSNDMDSTRRRSNQRREGAKLPDHSSCRCRSTGRRKSLPSLAFGSGQPNDATPPTESTCQSKAPKMPTRCVSDDSGDDSDSDDDEGFHTPTPNVLNRIPRRMRRMSMPAVSSSDELEDNRSTKAREYSPCFPRCLARVEDRSKSLVYGMDLGYGFDPNGDNTNNTSQQQPVEIKPVRMPRIVLNKDGGPGFRRWNTNPSRPTYKLLDSPGSAGSGFSSDEMSIGFPRRANRAQNRRKKMSRNRRIMRRCSTGGPLDQKFCKTMATTDHYSPEESQTEIQPPRLQSNESWGSVDEESDHTALQKMHPRRLSTGSSDFDLSILLAVDASTESVAQDQSAHKTLMISANENPPSVMPMTTKEPELGYEDIVPSPQHDELPSMEDLGYGRGNESMMGSCMSSFMSIESSVCREELGYDVDLRYGDLGFAGRFENLDDHDISLPPLSRMPRRSSTGEVHGGTSNGRLPKGGSTSGTYCQHRAPRRASNRTGEEGHCSIRRSSVGVASSSSHRPAGSRRLRSIVGGAVESLSPRMRGDSFDSICSEVTSVNAALLFAGSKKYKINPSAANAGDSVEASECQGMKDDSNVSSASPVSVSVVGLGYNAVLGGADPLACSEKEGSVNPADSEPSESGKAQSKTENDGSMNPVDSRPASEAGELQSKPDEDYWRTMLHENTPAPLAARQDEKSLSSPPTPGRRKSTTTACA